MKRETFNLALLTGAVVYNSVSKGFNVTGQKKQFTNIQQRASKSVKKENRAKRKAANLSRAKNRGK